MRLLRPVSNWTFGIHVSSNSAATMRAFVSHRHIHPKHSERRTGLETLSTFAEKPDAFHLSEELVRGVREGLRILKNHKGPNGYDIPIVTRSIDQEYKWLRRYKFKVSTDDTKRECVCAQKFRVAASNNRIKYFNQ